jgi:hypothetical protein
MDAAYIYIAIGAGVLGVLGALCLLVARLLTKVRRAQPGTAAQTSLQCEPFYLLKTAVRQLSPGFYVAQLVYSNKKDLAVNDRTGEPSRHFSEDKN